MDWKIFITIFVAVFIAELGDKTQFATMLFATDKDVSKYTIFFAASAALIVASAIGVLAERVRDYLRTDIGALKNLDLNQECRELGILSPELLKFTF